MRKAQTLLVGSTGGVSPATFAADQATVIERQASLQALSEVWPAVTTKNTVVFFADFAAGAYGRRDPVSGLILPRALGEVINLTRASTATFDARTGLTATAAANEKRITFNPVTKARRGLMVEPAATNIVPNSRNMSAAGGYSVGGAAGSVVGNAATGIDGAANVATLWTEDTSTNVHVLSRTLTLTAGDQVTTSARFKNFGALRHPAILLAAAGFTNQLFGVMDITTGAVTLNGTGTNFSGGSRPLGNGFWELWISAQCTVSVANIFQLRMSNSPTTLPSYTGDGASGLILDGSQQVTGNAPASSVIFTGASAVTRAADVAGFLGLTGTGDVEITYDDATTGSATGVNLATYTLPTGNKPIARVLARAA